MKRILLHGNSLIHHLDSAAFILDIEDRITDANLAARSYSSKPLNEIEGLKVNDAFFWWNDLEEIIQRSPEISQEFRFDLDGIRRYMNLNITPILGNAHSHIIGRLVVLRDISNEKLASEAVALAQIKTEFLAKVGHELRSPLTSILGIAEMLDYGVYGRLTDEQKQAVKIISESTQAMARLVNDLLQQSNLERGTFQLDITEFSVIDLINRAIEHAKPTAALKGLNLTMEIGEGIPEKFHGDSLRIYQVIVNLVDNAINYTLEGEVRLSVIGAGENQLGIAVHDTGVGIPKNLQRIIFNPFQRTESSAELKENGFGLGLAIVKQLVTLMDGQITLESEVGRGSTFLVTLPQAAAKKSQE